MRLIALLRTLRHDESGFTMVTVLTVMFCVTLLSIAALSAAQNDLEPGAHDKSRKVAYSAAEAGVQNYLYHLSQDLDYWAKCTTVTAPHAVNDPWNGVGGDTRTKWMSIPGSQARYAIELLPANGPCSTADAGATMIDGDTGTFKIRATGEDRPDGVKRSIVATFKRQSLLDYLYFTDKETMSASLYAMGVPSRDTQETGGAGRDLVTWASEQCDRYWGNAAPPLGGRDGQKFIGTYTDSAGNEVDAPDYICHMPTFIDADVLAGPFHTNDSIVVGCDSEPLFGDSLDDVVETSSLGENAVTPADPNGGWRRECADAATPKVNFAGGTSNDRGTWRPRAAPLTLPLTNDALKDDTADAYRFEGTTKIELHDTTMSVVGTNVEGTVFTGQEIPIPADGVVYVANDGSCPEYTPVDAYPAGLERCGNLELEGAYAANVTFTAENDIVVKDDLTRSSAGSPFLLGLIAQRYVRVYHPVTGCTPLNTCNLMTGCTNDPSTPTNVSIDAAIVSLTRSVIVDNWFCGASLGTLDIEGAIAQMHRGPTARPNDVGFPGYVQKDYKYDERLRYRSPPHFLDPVNAQWRVQTFTEQVPAR